jgi:hypothetical protein
MIPIAVSVVSVRALPFWSDGRGFAKGIRVLYVLPGTRRNREVSSRQLRGFSIDSLK